MTRGGDAVIESSRRMGFTVGSFAVVDFAGPIGLRPRIGYIRKGSTSSTEVGDRGEFELTKKYDYVELSVPVNLQIPISGRLTPRLLTGPFLGWNVKAEEKIVGLDNTIRTYDISGSVRDFQIGLVFGGGFSFVLGESSSSGLGAGKLSFDVRYHLGLSDIVTTGNFRQRRRIDSSLLSFDPAARNRGFVFALGVSF
jgi:hypothetical protein